MTLDIVRHAGGELRLSIDLPDGQTISATVIDLHEEQLSEGAMIPPPHVMDGNRKFCRPSGRIRPENRVF